MRLFKALSAQIIGFGLALLFVWLFPVYIHGVWRVIFTQSILAAGCSILLRQPLWWVPIHVFFLPAAVMLLSLQLPAWIYFGAVCGLTLVFWGTFKGDVPLFLSSNPVIDALEGIVEKEQPHKFIELGAGVGSVAVRLADYRASMLVDAYELAPIPWLITRLRSRKRPNLHVYRRSFWNCDLGGYQVVYAFLSPNPMPRLAEKIKREMRPGSLFIASSFPVPGWTPEVIRPIQDRRRTRLYCYRIR